MKNLSLILNGVLLVAVAVLFYLHFSSGAPKAAAGSTGSAVAPGELSIAYVNSDSLTKNYEFVKERGKSLEAKQKKIEADYANRVNSLRSEMAAYQRNVSGMTYGQQKAVEEDLGKKQQNLQLLEQSLRQQLAEDQGKISEELYNRVTAYLKTYGEQKGITVFMKYDISSDVLWANPSLDVTTDVLKGLNDEFAAQKSAPATKADTTTTK